MSSPKLIVQILISSTRILGKAFLEAGRQAVKNAKASPQGVLGNDVAGVGNASSASKTDQLTRQHRMTLDEAHLILNTKTGEPMEKIMQSYELLFKANSAPPAPPKPPPGKQPSIISHSHYIQSKVVRARERIQAEMSSPPPAPEVQPSPPPEVPPAGTPPSS